jgi:hypothetical protein
MIKLILKACCCALFLYLGVACLRPALAADAYHFESPKLSDFDTGKQTWMYNVYDYAAVIFSYQSAHQSGCRPGTPPTGPLAPDGSSQVWHVDCLDYNGNPNNPFQTTAYARCFSPGGVLGVFPESGDSVHVMCKVPGEPPPKSPDDCKDKNVFLRRVYYGGGASSYPAPNHYDGCVVEVVEKVVCRTDASGTYCYFKMKRTGDVYTGKDSPGDGASPSDKSDDTPSNPRVDGPPLKGPDPKICPNCVPCPAGTAQAGVDGDGVPICVGPGTLPKNTPTPPPVTEKPPVTTKDDAGNTTTKQDTVQQNSDGSTTTTTTTTVVNAAGEKTVTVTSNTTKNAAGDDGKKDATDPDKGDLCAKNPGLTVCKNSSVSGTCGQISCTGDAIQCATLRATAAMQCKQQADDDDLKSTGAHALGDSILKGNDPEAGNFPSASKADKVELAKIDNSGWMGGGSFFKDKTIEFAGKTVTVPLSQGADILGIGLRFITMAIASLASFKIVRGTFSGSGV